MACLEPPADQVSSPRVSFSAEFLEEGTLKGSEDDDSETEEARSADFEFLSGKGGSMLTADELFFEGKLLPCWQMKQSEKLSRVTLKGEEGEIKEEEGAKEEPRVAWFVDEDPSPRPPKCTVLWKELLRLKKQRGVASSLSPSSSSSSTSSSSSSLGDVAKKEDCKNAKRTKRGLERTRSAIIRIRPIITVPICSNSRRMPLLPMKHR